VVINLDRWGMESTLRRPVLELEGVGKRFGDGTLALDRIDLSVLPGELVGVVGPPGCGKSTLLRIAAGLAGPTSGMVVVRTRRIRLIGRDAATPPRSGLRDALDRCELLLLDEPFGALDELTRRRRNHELGRLLLERGFAALLATRSLPEAASLSSRVVVLSARPGRVVRALEVPFPHRCARRPRRPGALPWSNAGLP
jgi:NitT/TauT family transport system ATP-binding protein